MLKIILIIAGLILVHFIFGPIVAAVVFIVGGIIRSWNKPTPTPEPEPEQTGLSKTNLALVGLAAFTALASKGLNDLDDIPQTGGGPPSGSGGRTWHDGTGKPVQVGADGRMYYNGNFVGYRDSSGRITDGGGNTIGTLKDSGEYHDASGSFKGQLIG